MNPMVAKGLTQRESKAGHIIAVSGSPERAKKAADTSEEVTVFLMKPYTAEQLLQTLAAVLSKK